VKNAARMVAKFWAGSEEFLWRRSLFRLGTVRQPGEYHHKMTGQRHRELLGIIKFIDVNNLQRAWHGLS